MSATLTEPLRGTGPKAANGLSGRAEILARRREKAAIQAADATPDAPVTTEAKLADRYGRRH